MLSDLFNHFRNHKIFFASIFFLNKNIRLHSHLLVTLGTFLATSSNVFAASCPETNIARINFGRETRKTILETSAGKKYKCWLDKNYQTLRFQGITYDVVFRCHKTVTVYSHLDGIEEVVIDNNGSKSLYQADFLGDTYKCSVQGQTMIKPWIYKRGTDVIKQTDYYYTPYKW